MDNIKQIAVITGTRGLVGEVLIKNFPGKLFLPKDTEIFIGFSKNFYDKYELEKEVFTGSGNNVPGLFLKDITSKELAEELKEKGVFVQRETIIQHNPDFLFEDELIDCKVLDVQTDEIIGEISEIWTMPANDVWLVSTSEGDIPLPVIPDVIKSVDLEERVIKVFLIDGLLELMNKKSKED